MKIGLKIDVDTFRGTRDGVLPLARELSRRGQQATFYFAVGPDNMGRHIWRLLKPHFLIKMLRSNAPGLYGWDILLKGTFWPGPLIGKTHADIIRETAALGHEVGLHAWDHHAWQAHAISKGSSFVQKELQRGMECLREILGDAPATSAAPGWQADSHTVETKELFSFRYNSDCRGMSIFRPTAPDGQILSPQIPTTMPTYDELIGQPGITHDTYNARLLAHLRPNTLNVLCAHAEAEGMLCFSLFQRFCDEIQARGAQFVSLGSLLPADLADIPTGRISLSVQKGREGVLAVQS